MEPSYSAESVRLFFNSIVRSLENTVCERIIGATTSWNCEINRFRPSLEATWILRSCEGSTLCGRPIDISTGRISYMMRMPTIAFRITCVAHLPKEESLIAPTHAAISCSPWAIDLRFKRDDSSIACNTLLNESAVASKSLEKQGDYQISNESHPENAAQTFGCVEYIQP